MVSQKGGLEEGANELDPVVKLKWTDCNIGKYSNVALSYEHNSFIDYIGNVYKEYTAHKMDTSYYRSPVTMEKISMLFRGYVACTLLLID